jgi:hypothetical protein
MISRQEAINKNLKYYFTGKPCLYGHVTKRNVKTKLCYGCERVRSARNSLDLRTKVLQKFGSKCMQCGFDDFRALQIDHINGGGSSERKTLKKDSLYREVLKDNTNKYQLLCANCNSIKRIENNESGISPLSATWQPPQYGE